jgi:hypothetical protein
MGFPPNLDGTGDLEAMNLLAGQGVGLTTAIAPPGEGRSRGGPIVERLRTVRAAGTSASAL